MSFELGISYFLLMTMGWMGAHRFYLGKFWSGFFYLMTGGFCGIGIFLDFFLLPFLVDSQVNENYNSDVDGDILEFVSRTFGKIAVVGMIFCTFILALAIVVG